MTVKIRPYKRGGWEYDIMLTIPGRPPIRERRKAPVKGKADARRWAEERERQLFQHATNTDLSEDGRVSRPDVSAKEVPTLAQFAPRYMEGYCKANQLKPSTIWGRESALRSNLIPALGNVRLDRITPERVQRFKAGRTHLANSTVNHHLSILLGILNVAIEWGVIDQMPCKIKPLKEGKPPIRFYDYEEFDRLVVAAERLDQWATLLAVLIGGECGLRCGELQGLRWSDLDLKRGQLTVNRARWRGIEGIPKNGKTRTIPLADRVWAALKEHRHLRSPYVLMTRIGTVPQAGCIRKWLVKAQELAGFDSQGPHILRHTFCSHLAMAAKPARAIQMLAGHASIRTTERYMHLSPKAGRDAIDGLKRPANWRHAGDDIPRVANLH